MVACVILLCVFAVALCDDIYTVVWNSPSTNSSGSMPIGNGDVGASVWVDEEKLSFYISKTDSFDENQNILKAIFVVV